MTSKIVLTLAVIAATALGCTTAAGPTGRTPAAAPDEGVAERAPGTETRAREPRVTPKESIDRAPAYGAATRFSEPVDGPRGPTPPSCSIRC